MLSHLHFELLCQSIEHLVLIFFPLHRSKYNAETLAEGTEIRCMESVCRVLVGIVLFPVPNNGEKSTGVTSKWL